MPVKLGWAPEKVVVVKPMSGGKDERWAKELFVKNAGTNVPLSTPRKR